MSWNRGSNDEEEEAKDWEIEPEEEKADRHPALGGTAPLARIVFLVLLGLLVAGGGLALLRGLRSWWGQ